jgi:hypothetical protein
MKAEGETVTTTVHGIGGRSEKVTGTVVGHKRSALIVQTECHGRIMVTQDKIEPDVKSVYMLERADGSGYRRVSRSALTTDYVLEGVDGDEEANTVTYWYCRRGEEV